MSVSCSSEKFSEVRSAAAVAPALPGPIQDALRCHFSPRRARYITWVLSADELRVIVDLRDALILSRIKRMPLYRLQRFDCLVPCDVEQQRAYRTAQLEWIQSEFYLLSTRLGRAPTQAELSADFASHRNGLRFRAYYAMKYPQRMKLCNTRPPIAVTVNAGMGHGARAGHASATAHA